MPLWQKSMELSIEVIIHNLPSKMADPSKTDGQAGPPSKIRQKDAGQVAGRRER